ncbi:MAG: hypothetical protein JWR07_1931 [Nevskia sp.]|nr:hypothetical protein [Nevskia sp.]
MSFSRPYTKPMRARDMPVPDIPPRLYRGVDFSACNDTPMTMPKSPRAKNRAVLNLARMQPCLLQSPVCQPEPETTVACHGAGVANGKGLGYKTGDQNTVWGCWACNDFTDAYNGATAEEKAAVFAAGHVRQVEAWAQIAADPMARPWKRNAAKWALEQPKGTP